MRDANSASVWTDSGGRLAALAGTLATDYVESTGGTGTLTFLTGLHNIYALEATSLRPSPLQWDSVNRTYTGTATALAAFGARVRALNMDAAFVAFRNSTLDISNITNNPIAVVNGLFVGRTTRCAVSSGVDADGLRMLLVGQPVPDTYGGSLGSAGTNTLGGSITNLVGLTRRLTYNFSVSNLVFNLSGTIVTGSVAGVVVASTTLPEPPVPTLTARHSGDNIVLSWPTTATGYSLEFSASLTNKPWSPVLTTPVIVDGQNTVTNAMIGSAGFYRLHKP